MSGCGASAPPTSADTYWSVEQINPDGTVVWLHQDQLGSIRLATSATTANTVSTRTWDAYGKPKTTSGTITALLGNAGQYTDTDTGFQYPRARYYDPTTGQFLTRDPAAAITREPCAYGANDPINMVDPSGLAPWDAVTDFVDKAAPIVRGVSGVVADVAGVCAVVMKAGCAQVAVGASAVKATASTYMYARGDLSRGDLLTDYVQVGLSALGMRASGRASALQGRAASVLDDRAARVASSARWGSIPGLLRRGTTSPMLLRAGALEFRASMWWGLGALSDGTGLGLSGNSYLDC